MQYRKKNPYPNSNLSYHLRSQSAGPFYCLTYPSLSEKLVFFFGSIFERRPMLSLVFSSSFVRCFSAEAMSRIWKKL